MTPIQDGSFSITAFDLCLETDEDAQATIHISGVNFIEVRVLDKVGIILFYHKPIGMIPFRLIRKEMGSNFPN